MQFLRLRWGKVVEDRLYEDTYKLFIEWQKRLGHEEMGEGERQSMPQEQSKRESNRRKRVMMRTQPDGLAKWHSFEAKLGK